MPKADETPINDTTTQLTGQACDTMKELTSAAHVTVNGAPKDAPAPTPGPTPFSPRPPLRPKRTVAPRFMVCHHCERKLFPEDSSEYAHCSDCGKYYRVKPSDNSNNNN